MGKALFFDIDGTIWDGRQRIPDSTREAFRRMKERGHRLFISSGRTRVFIPDAPLMPLGFDGVLAGYSHSSLIKILVSTDLCIVCPYYCNYPGCAVDAFGL